MFGYFKNPGPHLGPSRTRDISAPMGDKNVEPTWMNRGPKNPRSAISTIPDHIIGTVSDLFGPAISHNNWDSGILVREKDYNDVQLDPC